MKVELGPVHDVYAEEDSAVVLVGDRVLVLAPVPSCIISALVQGPMTIEALAERVVERFGRPPGGDPVQACSKVVEELVVDGLVRPLKGSK